MARSASRKFPALAIFTVVAFIGGALAIVDGVRVGLSLFGEPHALTCAELEAVDAQSGRYDLSECSLDATSAQYSLDEHRVRQVWVALRPRGQTVDLPAKITLATRDLALKREIERARAADDDLRYYVARHWDSFYYRADGQYAVIEPVLGFYRFDVGTNQLLLRTIEDAWLLVGMELVFGLGALFLTTVGSHQHRAWMRRRAALEARRIAQEEANEKARALHAPKDDGF